MEQNKFYSIEVSAKIPAVKLSFGGQFTSATLAVERHDLYY